MSRVPTICSEHVRCDSSPTLLAAAALFCLGPTAASANDRYGTPPPLVVSPDLSAPWVLQLRRAPAGAQVQPTSRALPAGYAVRLAPPPLVRAPDYRQPAQAYRRPALPPTAPTPSQPPVSRAAYAAAIAAGHYDMRMDPVYLPREVAYDGDEKPGTIIIDTTQNFLYLVEKGGKARRYGVGTGKPGFEWAGTHAITAKREWPDWTPPAEMIAREAANGHVLPAHMDGGPANPLGARALYIGSTEYRIHGTNAPWTIGHHVSSGCIRMRNEDVIDLYNRVSVGTKVLVM